MRKKNCMLYVNYSDECGNVIVLKARSVERLAKRLPEDFKRRLTVYDNQGFVRGWIHGRDRWRAT